MSEILLIFSPDKKSFAARLAERLGAEGYDVALREVDPSGFLADVEDRAARVTLLLWSRPLAGAAMLNGRLAAVRKLPNLIELSQDGVAPQSGPDGRVILLSGWRGQPYHQGWTKLLDKLRSLSTPSVRITAQAASDTGRAAPRRPRRRLGVVAIGLAGIAALGVVGGSGAFRKAPVPVRQDPPFSRAAPAHVADIPAEPKVAPVVQPPMQTPSEGGAPRVEAARPAATLSNPAPARTRPTPRLPQHAVRRASPAQAPVRHYSARNSRTMRLFCARSGRGTPECRSFLRAAARAE